MIIQGTELIPAGMTLQYPSTTTSATLNSTPVCILMRRLCSTTHLQLSGGRLQGWSQAVRCAVTAALPKHRFGDGRQPVQSYVMPAVSTIRREIKCGLLASSVVAHRASSQKVSRTREVRLRRQSKATPRMSRSIRVRMVPVRVAVGVTVQVGIKVVAAVQRTTTGYRRRRKYLFSRVL